MNNRGFSLIELLTVIALIGILSAAATFGFAEYSKKSRMASQTRLLYGDLMEYRLKALYEKKNWTVKITANRYEIYSSNLTTVTPVSTVVLNYPVGFNSTTPVVFNSQGLANVSGKSVCISAVNSAVVDSIVISETRVQIGKRKEGGACKNDDINAQ